MVRSESGSPRVGVAVAGADDRQSFCAESGSYWKRCADFRHEIFGAGRGRGGQRSPVHRGALASGRPLDVTRAGERVHSIEGGPAGAPRAKVKR